MIYVAAHSHRQALSWARDYGYGPMEWQYLIRPSSQLRGFGLTVVHLSGWRQRGMAEELPAVLGTHTRIAAVYREDWEPGQYPDYTDLPGPRNGYRI